MSEEEIKKIVRDTFYENIMIKKLSFPNKEIMGGKK